MAAKRCDVVIPIWNQLEHTRTCLAYIIKNTANPYRLILIDNGSDQPTRDYLRSFEDSARDSAGGKVVDVVLVRNNENLGFVKAVNQGMRISDAPYVCILNNDTLPAPHWLENLVDFAERYKDIGLLNPLCNRPAGISLEEYAEEVKDRRDEYMEANQCFGYCLLVKREVIDAIGYLDEAFGMGCYDDTDYSMRAGIAGYRCVIIHSSYVHHFHGTSFDVLGTKAQLTAEGERIYLSKWPKYKRLGLAVFNAGSFNDGAYEDLLGGILYLARKWCWVNLWIFGNPVSVRQRLEAVAKKIAMPSHQNIKYNYLPDDFGQMQIAFRIIERSFGTKRRKQYDAVLANGGKVLELLGPACGICLRRYSPDGTFIRTAEDLVNTLHAR